MSDVFTIKELAARWKMGRTTLWAMMRSGKNCPKHFNVGVGSGSVRFRLADIEAFEVGEPFNIHAPATPKAPTPEALARMQADIIQRWGVQSR